MSEAELCVDVIECFQTVQTELLNLKHAMCELDSPLPAWFAPPEKLAIKPDWGVRQQAFAHLSQLEYLDDQLPREILVGAGLIAASKTTLQHVAQLNQAKDNFKQAVLLLKAAKISDKHPLLNDYFNAHPHRPPLGTTLRRMGMARIHLKQCYRRSPSFSNRPSRVSWTWANTRSIKRITKAEAEIKLARLPKDAGIEYQLQKLRQLPNHEPLAIIQELAPHLRTNISFDTAEGSERVMVKGTVPIFYLHRSGLGLPEYFPPGKKRGRDVARVARKDTKIDPDPFLPAIRAHRYLSVETTEATISTN